MAGGTVLSLNSFLLILLVLLRAAHASWQSGNLKTLNRDYIPRYFSTGVVDTSRRRIVLAADADDNDVISARRYASASTGSARTQDERDSTKRVPPPSGFSSARGKRLHPGTIPREVSALPLRHIWSALEKRRARGVLGRKVEERREDAAGLRHSELNSALEMILMLIDQ